MHDLFTHNLNVSSWVRWSPPWWLCRPPWRGPGPRGCAWPPEFGHWEFVLLQSASLMRWPGAELCWPLSETGIQSVAAVSIRLYGVMVSVCGVSWDWQRWARPGSSSSCHHTSTVQHSVLPAQYRYPALTTSHHLYSLKNLAITFSLLQTHLLTGTAAHTTAHPNIPHPPPAQLLDINTQSGRVLQPTKDQIHKHTFTFTLRELYT